MQAVTGSCAAALDEDLMSVAGYTLAQLMEVAGLGVARVTMDYIKKTAGFRDSGILIVCGPGNNGGDGLVAARYLASGPLSIASVCIWLPKESTGQGPQGMLRLARQMGIIIIEGVGLDSLKAIREFADTCPYLFVLDALFGFNYKGDVIKEPYNKVTEAILQISRSETFSSRLKLISIDVPSGWSVDNPDWNPGSSPPSDKLNPDVVISLTVPKACTMWLEPRVEQYLAGNFLTPVLAEKYDLLDIKDLWTGIDDIYLQLP
ncbi:putative NAD(P)H-hydrate epimerase [Giardia muris]|uniref:NAD(P)H-hydrate epimerase n=1 Tax=Giardia muris TaxID=5742 RepID=A0A4Z1T4N3_GIAMU|nr:putative NAD(P)H-hydrate epimerase [Giardia muris]|eukprot:TNJ30628.1 putative NAD(P)H-hydrate epimerase [Giardia muris]